jgi:hypothetical protein
MIEELFFLGFDHLDRNGANPSFKPAQLGVNSALVPAARRASRTAQDIA